MTLDEAIKIISKINRWYHGTSYNALTYIRKNVDIVIGHKDHDEWKTKWYGTKPTEEILKEYGTYDKCVDFTVKLSDDKTELLLEVVCFRGDNMYGERKFKDYTFYAKLKEIPEFVKDTIEYVKYEYLRNLHSEWKQAEKLKWMDAKFDEIMGEE